jgi:hypothetical protein
MYCAASSYPFRLINEPDQKVGLMCILVPNREITTHCNGSACALLLVPHIWLILIQSDKIVRTEQGTGWVWGGGGEIRC